MLSSRLLIRASFIRNVPLGGVFFAGALLAAVCVVVVGCSEKKATIESIQEAYYRHDYAEAVVLCERALRNDVSGSEVYLFYGLSLISVDRDIESFAAFKRAVALDGELGPGIAAGLVGTGANAFDRGETTRAALRLRTAVEIYPEVGLGRYGFLVAEAYFDDREFEQAGRIFSEALAEFPDTVVAESALFKLSECLSEEGDSLGAIEILERQLRSYPVGTLAERAEWRLVSLLFESARAEFDRGNYETAAAILTKVVARSDNPSLVLKSRFMVGECHERTGDFEKAYVQYRAVIDEDMGASARLVERARSKIKTMEDAGLLDDLPNELR